MALERLTLTFSPTNYNKPIIYHLVKDYNLKINILKAEITPGEEGRLLADFEGDDQDLDAALQFLKEESIGIVPTSRQIQLRQDECVHCGACTAVCFSGALTMDENAQTRFRPERCIVCGLCLDACPRRAIQVAFGSECYEV